MDKRKIQLYDGWDLKLIPSPALWRGVVQVDMTGLSKLPSDPFLASRISEEMRNYQNFDDVKRIMPNYYKAAKSLEAFVMKWAGSVDKTTLSTTTAMSLVQTGHTFLDEFGCFTLSRRSEIPLMSPYPYISEYNERIPDARKVVASYPRGKNTGLPIIVSGMDRLVSNIVNVLNLMTATALQNWVYECEPSEFANRTTQLKSWLNQTFGYADSQVVFARQQHTGKAIPVYFLDQLADPYMSSNLVPRRRVVNSTIKWVAMALKAVIKCFTQFDLKCPAFDQDRDSIRSRITRCVENGGVVMATDQSRFDLRHGLDKLQFMNDNVMIPRLKDVFGDRVGLNFHTLMMIEQKSGTIIPTREACYMGDGDVALKSGESGTSRKGSYMNLIDDMTVTAVSLGLDQDGVNDYYKKYHPSVILGDDLLKLFPSRKDFDAYVKVLESTSKTMGVSMEVESPTKFLGMVVYNARDPLNGSPLYDSPMKQVRDGKVSWTQPITSVAQKTALPERFRSRQYPTFGALVKFFALPFDAIDPATMRSEKRISQKYLDSVRTFYSDLYESRLGFSDAQAEYFKSVKDNLPSTPSQVVDLYSEILKDPSKYGVDVKYDMDEILNIIFKGMEYDLNWSVLGIQSDDESQVIGTLDSVLDTLVKEIPSAAKASDFVSKVVRVANSLQVSTVYDIQQIYNSVIDNHKLLGMRYSPGLPIYR